MSSGASARQRGNDTMSGSGKALLFDIDGTLADTDALHLQAFNQVFGPPAKSSIATAPPRS